MLPTDPIILVPGFSGSELRLRTWFRYSAPLWLSPPALIAGGMSAMRLAVPYSPATDPTKELTLGEPLGNYYGLLADFLRGEGWSVNSPFADWRRPGLEDAGRLVQLIRTLTHDGSKCGIVCHSRGGLVTRRALAILGAAGEIGRVTRVVGLGVPHTGSMDGVANLGGNGDIQESLFNLGKNSKSYFGYGLGLTDIYAVMASWPALYELLPDPDRSWLPPDIRAAIYDPNTYPLIRGKPEAANIALAAANWRSLPAPDPAVDWIDVVGTGLPTALTVPDVASLTAKGGMVPTLDGDGTVPSVSAGISPRRRITTPCVHGLLPQDGRVWGHIHQAFLNGLPADVVIQGDTLNY